MSPQNTPWKLNEDGDIEGADGNLVPISGVSLPARNHPDRKAAEYNRLLLASAPDLLKALERLMATFGNVAKSNPEEYGAYVNAMEVAREARGQL